MIVRRCLPVSLRRLRLARVATIALIAVLAACGGGDKQSGQIEWIPGTPPNEAAQIVEPTPTTEQAPAGNPTPTTPREEPPPTPGVALVTGRKLTADELEQFRPNELGLIPVLEYHDFVTDPADEAQFARTIDDFRADLEWLYAHDFYVVPLRDVITNAIKAPAGKHPVVLTFDDSYASQFRYLIADDGAVTIDPDTAVGIMEAMYAAHPDFGRGGFFAVIPNFCFNWQPTVAETDQTPYCAQKIAWLLDNGYEIGNHTRDHEPLFDVDDDEFKLQIGGAIEALQAYDPRVTADIIAMPYGDYPDSKKHPEQRRWLREGFVYNDQQVNILGCLMVGANPTESPVSTEYDSMWIARIQAWDNDARKKDPDNLGDAMSLTDWFDVFASDPDRMYTSDGDPNTITVPDVLAPAIDGTFDESKTDGKVVVRY